MSKSQYDLTQGNILNRMLLVALPIMGTQLMQMAYNLVDMFWLGRLSPEAVVASGTGGMYLWLAFAFIILGRMGAEIGVAQNLGRKDPETARSYSQTALQIAVCLGLIYGALLFFGSDQLIGFFALQDPAVASDASGYLAISGLCMPFMFISAVFTGTFNASGNSRFSFKVNIYGQIANIILDPIMIFGLKLGVRGVAVATVISQLLVVSLFLYSIKYNRDRPFANYSFVTRLDFSKVRQIVQWCTPIVLENLLFTSLAMLTTRLIATFGTEALAVQRIGSQIESLSWLIAGGFGSALTAFVGQNYGAGKWTRIRDSFKISTRTMFIWGTVVTFALFFCGRALYGVFLPDDELIKDMGQTYIRILAICQIAACLEAVAAGAFRGTGQTLPPSLVSISCNSLRVLFAYLLAATSLGLNGVWWAVTICGSLRGFGIFIWYLLAQRKQPNRDLVAV